MRCPRRYYQHVALFQVVALAVLNVLGSHLAGPGLSGFDSSAADYDSRASVHDIENVSFLLVDFDVSVRRTLIGLYVVLIAGNQRVRVLLIKIIEHPLAIHVGGTRFAILSGG